VLAGCARRTVAVVDHNVLEATLPRQVVAIVDRDGVRTSLPPPAEVARAARCDIDAVRLSNHQRTLGRRRLAWSVVG
jgi:hypothetical protein